MSRIDKLMELLDDATYKFWTCPNEHPRKPGRTTVIWDGDVATCVDCGMTNLTDPRNS